METQEELKIALQQNDYDAIANFYGASGCERFLQYNKINGLSKKDYLSILFCGLKFNEWRTYGDALFSRASYNDILTCMCDYDKNFNGFYLLVKKNKARALSDAVELTFGKSAINKTAIRSALKPYPEIIPRLIAEYKGADSVKRESVVRLLLLFKTDYDVSELLQAAETNDRSKTVRELIAHNSRPVTAYKGCEFELMMCEGRIFSVNRFKEMIKDDALYDVASKLFFTHICDDSGFRQTVTFESGSLLDLNNQPITVNRNDRMLVTHPLDVPKEDEFIFRLNIEQPFLQIRRPTFKCRKGDYTYDCDAVKNNIVSVAAFNRAMSAIGFRRATTDRGSALVLELNSKCEAVHYSVNGNMVTGGNINFFSPDKVLRVNRKLVLDGFPSICQEELSPREYSEFVYHAKLLFTKSNTL